MGSDAWANIGIKKTTKARLDENRAPGQNYNGFIWQLIDLWERTEKVRAGSAGGNQGAEAIRSQTA